MPRTRLGPGAGPRALLVVVWLGSGPAWTPQAFAGDVAPSAYASSRSMPGLLLEAPWLLHLHPQLTATVPSHVGATATLSFGGPEGIQAVLRAGDLSFFAFSQTNVDLTAVPVSTELLQVGAAWQLGGLRIGAAGRGTLGRADERTVDDYTDTTAVDRDHTEEYRGDRIEGALGFGFGDDETFFDLTFEASRERFETLVRDFNSRDSLEVDIDGLPQNRYGGAARIGFRGPWNSRLQLVGTFRDRTARVNVDHIRPDTLGTVVRDDYGHLWRAGLTISRDVRLSSLTFFALYANRDGPTEYQRLYSSYRAWHETLDIDDVQFGVALRREFWGESLLLVGVQNRFELRKDRSFREQDDGAIDLDTTTTERISRSFAWGLQRSFESLDLTGSMRTDLAAGSLFVSLDAIYRL